MKGVSLNTTEGHHRAILRSIAHRVMIERGLLPDFSSEVLAELERLRELVDKPTSDSPHVHDMRNLLWVSIDNDDSLDLDQLTVAEALPGGQVRIMVAIADVDSLVRKGTALDKHAQ